MTMEDLNDIFDVDLELTKPEDEPILEIGTDLDDDNIFEGIQDTKLDENSVLTDFLKSKGIEDSKITILDEEENEKEVNFYELSKDEQLEILTSITQNDSESETDLDESELDLINHLRSNNLTVTDFLESYKQSIIEELGGAPAQSYDIDSYDDQELFLLDQKNKYNLTDEELVKVLELELQDETLFKKKVDILRGEYKQLEDQYNQNQQIELEQQREEQYEQFSESIVNVALQTPEFYGIELEDDEKNEVLSFLLDLDEEGTSEFYKTLNDPKKLYEAAWFLRYGKESFDALKNAYESEIAKLKKPDKPSAVRRTQSSGGSQVNSIHDLNF